MAASDHLHPEQMKLFMTGTELKGAITGSIDRAPMQSMDDMWKRKTRESKSDAYHGGGTHASLKAQGWVGPGPGIYHRREYGPIPEFDKEHLQVDDAHHRIAAAADIEAKSKGKRNIWIPTTDRSEADVQTRSQKFKRFDQDAM
jgi:hypothetical protein